MTEDDIFEIFKSKEEQLTVNSNKDLNTVNSNKDITNTVNSNTVKEEHREIEIKTNDYLNEICGNPNYIADKLARELDDTKSYRYYQLLALNNDIPKLLEALSYTKMASNEGKIRTKKAVYFNGIIKNWGLKTKFGR